MIHVGRTLKHHTRGIVRRALAILMAALCMITVFGCKKAQETAQEQIVLPTPEPSPQPVAGGEMTLPMPVNADLYNPLAVNTEEMLTLFSLIYDSLIEIDDTGKLAVGLAETWTVDDSGKTWTVKLRSGATWQDSGERLSAYDVKYTFERIKQMTASYYSYNISKISNMTVIDDSTLEITMYETGLGALYSLTFPIVRDGTLETDKPVGTGPYSVLGLSENRVTLTVNPNWWKQPPYIERIVFLARDNNETALASYEAGQMSFVPTSSVAAGRYRDEGVTNVLDVMTQTAEVLYVNSRSKFSNIAMRQALAYGLDRSVLISNVYMNRAQSCDVPIAPDQWLYDSKSKVFDFNTAKALELFASQGYTDVDGDGKLEYGTHRYDELTATLLVSESTDTVRGEAADMIASQLGELGIKVEVVRAKYVLGDPENEYETKLNSGDFDLALVGINLSRDCELSSLVNRDGTRNYGGFYSGELESLARSITTSPDEASMRENASAFQMKFVEELPFIVLYFRANSIVYSADIKNVSGIREPDIMRTVEKWYVQSD